MSAARLSLMALLVAAGGCGSVPEDGTPDAGSDAGVDARPPPGSTVYRGTMVTIPPVTFGGMGATAPFCTYTIELRQVELELVVSTTGQITGGTAQALAVETRLASTTPACTAGPGIPPNIHKFTFRSAAQSGNTTTVMMNGATTNEPITALSITLTPSAGAFSAASRFARTGGVADPVLTWAVNANLTLTVKP